MRGAATGVFIPPADRAKFNLAQRAGESAQLDSSLRGAQSRRLHKSAFEDFHWRRAKVNKRTFDSYRAPIAPQAFEAPF